MSRRGLKLETIFTMVTPCPYAEEFKRTCDAAGFGKAYVPTLRSGSETMFAGALDPSRSVSERAAIVDDFYRAYQLKSWLRPKVTV